MEIDPSIGRVGMDIRSIHSTLMNLASNAIDACIYDDVPGKSHRVWLKTSLESGDAVRFEVGDNGMGMEEEVRDKIFTSFFSTKGHKGTGLGLLVSRKLIEEHDGSIEVQSEPGAGTTFIVKVPFMKVAEDRSFM
jgi:signal transduction histidine kinase